MMLNFFPQVYNFTVDGEKVLLQFLLLTFASGFIYITCRSMRIVEKEYNKTSKEIKKLRTRMEVVRALSGPICQNVLYYNVIRYRHSLIANYLKDLIHEEGEPEKFSNFFNDFPESSSKQTSSCSLGLSEKIDSLSKSTTEKSLYKENPHVLGSSIGGNFRENISQNKYNLVANKVKGRKNDFRVVKSSLESKIFKTIEGQNKRLRSSLLDKRKPKISKWNLVELKKNENLTVCSALTSTRSPFKVKAHAKFSTHKLNLAPKSSYTIQKTDSLSCKDSSTVEENTREENKTSNLEEEKIVAEVSNIQENCSVHSIGSSGGESDNESDRHSEQSPQTPLESGNVRHNIPLTTINEESAEESCVSE